MLCSGIRALRGSSPIRHVDWTVSAAGREGSLGVSGPVLGSRVGEMA